MKQRLVFTLMMSFTLSVLMTLWITFINLGAAPDFFARWLKAWVLAWPTAFVIAFITGPTIQKLSMRFK